MTLAVIVSLIILALLSLFQLLLIAGVPLGHFAWGGQHNVLPRKLRIGSVFSIFIYALIAICILSKASVLQIIPAGSFLDIICWIIFAYLALGIFMNAISRSKKERYTMTPVAAVLAICLYMVASS
ncbi:MAG: hypothetical protein JWO54_933 [Candidatus Saccharibacteria bacterium]|nr:hypothetical protein [Candidatus Saccharibacteria bacterium]